MKKKEMIPYSLYLYIANKALENGNNWGMMREKQLELLLNKWNIPKILRKPIIRELKLIGLIYDEGDGWISFDRKQCDVLNIGMIYRKLGFY